MVANATNPIKNDSLERKRRKKRIVDEHTSRDYYLNGKRVNRNVYELQKIYEDTQAKTTKILPEFLERIRFMIVRGIKKQTREKYVDQSGELFNHVLMDILRKIVPTVDPETKKLVTRYDPNKANLGACILNTCQWSVRNFQGNEDYHESLLRCGEFFEDYNEVAEEPKDIEIGNMKFISSYGEDNSYVPLVQSMLGDAESEE